MSTLTYLSLFDYIESNPQLEVSLCLSTKVLDALKEYVCQRENINYQDSDEDFRGKLEKKVKGFCSSLKRKWVKVNRNKNVFLREESQWLSKTFEVDLPVRRNAEASGRRGRPVKDFESLTHRGKLLRTADIRASTSTEELTFAAKSKLNEGGKRTAAGILGEATETSPNRPLKMRRTLFQAKSNVVIPYSPEEALALIVDARLTRDAYQRLRNGANNRGADIYPTYDCVLEGKKKCYPEDVVVDGRGAYIPMQRLLDHTSQRLIDTLEVPNPEDLTTMKLYCKWGCDGSSGHNEYMQKRVSSDAPEESVFMFSLVPLLLTGQKKDSEELELWRNKKPSSVAYCRPIKFLYMKEDRQNTKNEVAKTQKEIDELHHLSARVNESVVPVTYELDPTMIDGKVVSNLTGISGQNCFLCGSTPTTMNDIDRAKEKVLKEENFKYGLSTLHLLINSLGHALKVAYYLELKITSRRGITKQQQESLDQRKQKVKDALFKELNIKVDRVVQGKGTSNTGNVARIVFQNSGKAAKATGLNENYLRRMSVIIQTLSSGYEINSEAFDEYALNTAKVYVKLYGWYRMPASVHKILMHGGEVVRRFLLPVGMLSEEAQEARNKDFRRIREHNTRKMSRRHTTRDIINGLLVSSDPVVTGCRHFRKTKHKDLHPDAKKLLNIPDNEQNSDGEGGHTDDEGHQDTDRETEDEVDEFSELGASDSEKSDEVDC